MMTRNHSYLLLLLMACITLIGCGPDTKGRQSISGSVNFGGSPMAHGSISFQPIGEVKSSAGADVVNGQFNISAIKGLLPGEYSVVFTCNEPSGKKIKTQTPEGQSIEEDEMVSFIPLDYGQKTTQRVNVVKGKNFFEFNVPRNNRPIEKAKQASSPVI